MPRCHVQEVPPERREAWLQDANSLPPNLPQSYLGCWLTLIYLLVASGAAFLVGMWMER